MAINRESFTIAAGLDTDASRATRLKERSLRNIRISDFTELQSMYTFSKEIGKGSFGTVIAATEKRNERQWAIKIICKTTASAKAMKMVQKEISILKMVNHPHIIYLDKIFECSKKIYLVFERCLAELATVYEQRKPFPESEARQIIKDLNSAVEYLHKNSIVHRDIKMENILVTTNPSNPRDQLYVKLTDFGLGAIKTGAGHEDMLHDWCGTLTYMSPEIITNQSYSQQTDIWALGVITYMLLGGQYPFYSMQEKDLKNLICRVEPSFTGFTASPEAINVITRMLAKNPAMRITAVEISQHPWITGTSIDNEGLENVLDMMRLWRSEMMLPIGEECDWAVSNVNNQSAWTVPVSRHGPSESHSVKSVKSKASSSHMKDKAKQDSVVGTSSRPTSSKYNPTTPPSQKETKKDNNKSKKN